jgi:hypothetical protein
MRRGCALGVLVALTAASFCEAANITWVGANADWVDGAGNANWNPADEPDPDDVAIFNTNNSVNLGSNNLVAGLTMSGSIDLDTNGFKLVVEGLVQLSGASTNLFINAGSTVDADDVTIGSGARVELTGGTLVVDEEGFLSGGVLTISAGGTLAGHGTVNLADTPLAPSTLLNNNGTLTATRPSTILNPPQVGSLVVNGGGTARIDLDGSSESGAVNVNRNQTLDINLPLADAFNGTMSLFHNTTLDVSSAWTLGAGGQMFVDNGATGGLPSTPAGTSTIAGGALTQTGGTITVVDTDGTIIFDAPFTMNGGSFANNGLIVFNANATIAAGANFTMPTGSSSLTVNANRTVTVHQANFNADGTDTNTNLLTINSGGALNLNLGAGADESLNGTIFLNGGALDVTTASNTWSITRAVTVGDNTGVSQLNGETLVTSAAFNVGANSTLSINAPLNVNLGSTFFGAGKLTFNANSTFLFSTAIDVAAFDWDGSLAGQTHTINSGVELKINSPTFDDDGEMSDNITLAGAGSKLEANTQGHWVMRGTLTANQANAGVASIGGSRMVLGVIGVLNVMGNTELLAPVSLEGSSTINAGATLTLKGGTMASANIMSGGTISGAGLLAADAGKVLRGSGVINTPINFSGNSQIIAAGGVLDLNGSITHVGALRSESGGNLQLPPNFSTTATDEGIILANGTLSGPTVTVGAANRPLRGVGLVATDVNNNGVIEADGGLLTLSAASTDFDGSTNLGQLRAVNGGTLKLNGGPTFNFAGTVQASGGSKVWANNFNFHFGPASTLSLTGSSFEATNSMDINGQVTIGAGESTIEVEVNRFLDFESTSSTTLNGNLRLESNNASVAAGATFSGSGALVVPDGSHLTLAANANVNVLLDNQGTIRPAGFDSVGRVDVKDYQQSSTGEWFMEITGTNLNQYDRVVVNGVAQLGGLLNVDIDGGFIPALGNTFNILSATGGVAGQFDQVDVSGFPAGLTVHVNYLPTLVQLQVVSMPFFSADFDNDGDVDPTDLQIWRGAYNLNQLGDADGDNDSDGADFLMWQQQVGSAPAVIAAGAVPEPGALPSAAIGVGALVLGRWRRFS